MKYVNSDLKSCAGKSPSAWSKQIGENLLRAKRFSGSFVSAIEKSAHSREPTRIHSSSQPRSRRYSRLYRREKSEEGYPFYRPSPKTLPAPGRNAGYSA